MSTERTPAHGSPKTPRDRRGAPRRGRSAVLVAACGAAAAAAATTTLPALAGLPPFILNSVWNGGTGNWGVSANWTPPTFVPNNGNGGNDYDATIGAGFATLDISPTIQQFTFNGGQLTTSGRTLTVNDRLTWNGGIFNGTGVVNAMFGIVVASGTNEHRIINGQTINHSGTGTMAAGLTNATSGTFNNLANGTIDLRGVTYTGGTLNNMGLIRKTTAVDTLLFPTVLNNTGTIRAESGILYISNNATHAGTYDGAGQVSFFGDQTFSPTSRLLTQTLRFAGTATVNGLFAPKTSTVEGPLTINGPQQYPSGAFMSVQGGALTLNTDAGGTGAGNLELSLVFGSRNVFNTTQHFDDLSIQSDATAVLSSGGTAGSKAIVTRSIIFADNEQLDLTKHGLVVDFNGSMDFTFFRKYLVAGYHGGAWNGTGIASSNAAANTQTALGYGVSSDVLGLSGTQTASFCGTTVDATSTLVRYTLYGDANLDGQVNFSDLVRLAQNYNVNDGNRVWAQADFNYDGNVNFSDLVKLAQNYNSTLLAGPMPDASAAFEADWARALASVPEPGAGLLLASLALALAPRRKRPNPPAVPRPAPS
jgi:hypothetical protein